MINCVYQLTSPSNFSIKYSELNLNTNLIIRPLYMSICHADQRYYLGLRDIKKLREKLPMALIHESVGEIIYDPTDTYKPGHKVVMVPNSPDKNHKTNSIIYENYQKNSKFLSSGHDGFMREFVDLPADRVVSVNNIDIKISSICEFISVAVHAVERFKNIAHEIRENITIWGDGSLAYVLSCVIQNEFPGTKLTIIGKNEFKLSKFWFADNIYLTDDLPKNFQTDHAFECVGGDHSHDAINSIINHINPQGTAILLGVSENKIAINTRDILEKGLTFVGSSRSGRTDFEKAASILENSKIQKRIEQIIFEDAPVRNIADIHRVFKTDLNTPFKTIFKWEL